MTRRGFVKGAAAIACLGLGGRARAAAPARLAAVDWAMFETALALGATPVAAAELKLFRSAAVEPPVPAETADLGLRGSLSYESLLAARPDLILISPWYESRRHVLERIAPVESHSVYEAGRAPYDPAVAVTRALGARLGRVEDAERAIAAAADVIAEARATLERLRGRRALIMNLADARHFRAFGQDSMYGDVIGRLGLSPAWAEATRWGAFPTVGVEALAEMDDVVVINVGPTPPAALAEMRQSPLWNAMPPIAAGRFVDIAPVNPYGGLPAAMRFARLASQALAALKTV